jgi:hypothetical protein
VSAPAHPPEKGFSLARWSARKREAERARTAPEPMLAPDVAARTAAAPVAPAPAAAGATKTAAPHAPGPLPDVDSLTFDSDFTAFMGKDVDADVRRAALRKLLRDPRFNVMDGLDVYIDDYTREDPIPPAMLARLDHAAALFAPLTSAAEAPGDAGGDAPEASGEAAATSSGALAASASRDADAGAGHCDADAEAKPPQERDR